MNPHAPTVGTHPTPTQDQLARARELDMMSERSREAREESYARCGTDGFLTQAAHGWTSSLNARRAEILRNGGSAWFLGLFRRNADGTPGERVRAVLRDGSYGEYWAICDEDGSFTGRYFSAWKTIPDYDTGKPQGRRSKLWKAGLIEAYESAPARAELVSDGFGTSGNVWITSYRTDGGFPPDAVAF